MQICIAGWYFDAELLNLMTKVNEYHKVHIVAHRDGDNQGLPMTVIPNKGLEFGCYDYFLKYLWDGESDVLFMHDDLVYAPVLVNYEVIPAINIINKIAGFDVDQAYVFKDEADAEWNACKHGRMIFMSGRLLKDLKDHGGIWYDKSNDGRTTSGDYNAGIVEFQERMLSYAMERKFDTCNVIFAPAITFLRRNGEVPNTLSAVVGGKLT